MPDQKVTQKIAFFAQYKRLGNNQLRTLRLSKSSTQSPSRLLLGSAHGWLTLLLVFLPLVCGGLADLRAADGFAYDMEVLGERWELRRLHLASGEIDLVEKDSVNANNFMIGIDRRVNAMHLLTRQTTWVSVVTLDLDTYKIRSQGRWDVKIYGIPEFNPIDGCWYLVLPRPRMQTIVKVNPNTMELSYVGSIRRNTEIFYPSLDYARGLFFGMDFAGQFLSYDYFSGREIKREYIPNETGRFLGHYAPQMRGFPFLEYTGGPDRESRVVFIDPLTNETQAFGGDWRTHRRGVPDISFAEQRFIGEVAPGDNGIYDFNGKKLLDIDFPEEESFEDWTLCRPAQASGMMRLSGRIVFDDNNNCQADTDEEGISGGIITIEPGGLRARSDSQGDYFIDLHPGTYTISIWQDAPLALSCPQQVRSRELTLETANVADIDFLLDRQQARSLPRVSLSVFGQQRYFGGEVFISLVNEGNFPFNGTMVLEYDEAVSGRIFSLLPDTELAGRTEWTVNDLAVGAAIHLQGIFSQSQHTDPVNEVCAELKMLDDAGLAVGNLSARDQTCITIDEWPEEEVVNMLVAGSNDGDATEITAQDSLLRYAIHFQYPGSGAAGSVRIINRIDPALNSSSIDFGACSNEFRAELLDDRTLEIRIDSTYYPSTEINWPWHRGTIRYSIKPNPDLEIGSEFTNCAEIIFDDDVRVETNCITHKVTGTISSVDEWPVRALETIELVQLAANEHQLRSDERLRGRLSVYSILGVKVLEQRLENVLSATVDLRSQAAGRYLLRLEVGGESIVTSLVVLR